MANPAGSGTGVREFRIGTPEEFHALAAAHFDLASEQVSLAGAAAADGCGDLDLVRGNPPPRLVFQPERWLRIERSRSTPTRERAVNFVVKNEMTE